MSYVHINRGVNVKYFARVRFPGHRKWELIGRFTRNKEKAYRTLSRTFSNPAWKRGQLCMVADYYDPIVVVEMKRP